MTGWVEVASGVLQRRYQPLDISICVVRGTAGLLVVDTRSSHREAREILADLREIGAAPVRWVVDTHAHYDHTFGNAVFAAPDVGARLYGHVRLPAHLDAYERGMLARWLDEGRGPVEDWREVVITPPHVLVDDGVRLDLGDREVVLRHLGRGHTDNDLVVHVPDVATWLVGDVLEESGPPMYGSGSYPLDWPGTVAALVAELEPDAVLVPGHGSAVDARFASAQGELLAEVARLVRELHAAGVPEGEAVAAAGDEWPYPVDQMAAAVRDGYRQLSG